MRRIWLMAMAVVVIAALVGGLGTMALFSTSADVSSTFTAGTVMLDGDRDEGDTVPGPMFYTTPEEGMTTDGSDLEGLRPTGYWAPGDTNTRVFQIENIGSLDAKLKSISATVQNDPNGLAPLLDVVVSTDPAGTQVVASGKLDTFAAGKAFTSGPIELAVGDIANLWIAVSLPITTGDAYQAASFNAEFSVYAEQSANN